MGKRAVRQNGDSKVGVGYVRVSKSEQALSPEAQAKAIERFAREQGITLVCTCIDIGVSSADEAQDREGLALALRVVRDHRAGVLIVARRDRLGRDLFVVTSLERMLGQGGATLVSASGEGNGDSASDLFFRRILDAKAELERADIRSRTKSALAVKAARGEKTGGGCPFGYTVVEVEIPGQVARLKTLAPLAPEQAIIRRAHELRAGDLSLQAIADVLTVEGLRSRTGRAFAAMQVSRMLDGEATVAA